MKEIARRTMAAGCFLAAACFLGSVLVPPVEAEKKAPSKANAPVAVKVNRTVPKVEAPKAKLEFSARPTHDEIFRARIFAEPLVPVGGQPAEAETAALAEALLGYAKRSGLDDFSSLTGFLEKYPKSPWRAALLTDLGLEYYNTAHYSRALEAWAEAWALAKDATEAKGKGIGDRAAGELAAMYARLGRMEDLEPLLESVEERVFVGPATEKISGARAGLSNMKERPEIAFRCGPLALHRIKFSLDPQNAGDATIIKSASTQKGFYLDQVAELSRKVDLNYEMAFREKGSPIAVPSVVHWKVGHYAAITRQEGDRFLVQDPTFINDVWATREALESESSGYFLIPREQMKDGWRAVEAQEASGVWGKGNVGGNDPNPGGCDDNKKKDPCGGKPCPGMAVANAHLMLVSLNIVDQPVGYEPPVGPAVSFQVTYNQREANQPTAFSYSNFGPKWTFEWLSYITDNPFSPAGDVRYFMRGGGTRVFNGFNAATQTFAFQQYNQDRLTRTSANSYEILSPDGSRKIFAQPDGSNGTTRRVFLTQMFDPSGNAVSLTYDAQFRLVAVTDAIGQVSTFTYANATDIYKITRITDPFGRFAKFDYDLNGRLTKITDVIGIESQFAYEGASDFINALITPYGTTSFTKEQSGTTKWLETLYPNGERDRVEFNQLTNLGIPQSVPASQLPAGMRTRNEFLSFRNTYYWDRNAYAAAYPDYTKARLYHWLHTADGASAAGILESEKEPLEGRVWYDYPGQGDPIFVGTSNKPTHVGRVLDDGTTQLYTYEYDSFGHVTKAIDPVGRTTSYVYAPNGIDLLEVRQTRGGSNELLYKATYNAQHQPLTVANAAGQTTTFAYNARGQLTTRTNAKNEVVTASYGANGYLTGVNGALPGAVDSVVLTYDAFGRIRTRSEVSGHTVTLSYDALDRLTRITFPDNSYSERTFVNLDLSTIRHRSGQQTSFEYDALGQLRKRTDAFGRVTLFDWCKCADLRSTTDDKGRTTSWRHDVQSRVIEKKMPDGAMISYAYEPSIGRLQQRTDERSQVTRYAYNLDNSLRNITYGNTSFGTPPVTFSYDPIHRRLASMTDGTGTTRYSYGPVTVPPSVGATLLSSVDGPLPNDTITYSYDELGRALSRAINGVAETRTFNAAGKFATEGNPLGTFTETYDPAGFHHLSETHPNGQTTEWAYDTIANDEFLQRITNKRGSTVQSEFVYTRDPLRQARITTWSQKAGAAPPSVYTFGYNDGNEVTSASRTNAPAPANFGFTYDRAGNRLTETLDAATTTASYNALNELTSVNSSAVPSTYEWDGEQRLTAVNSGNGRTEFSYDGLSRRVQIRKLVNGSVVSNRRFVWCDDGICEERDAGGAVTKRFFAQGVQIVTGANPGNYFWTRDHLGSVREMVDSGGAIRARYSYDPYGRRTKVSGDLEADFGFAGMFWSPETNLSLTKFRAYDANIGRWLSRDPLYRAEFKEGPNLYSYVSNNPVNLTDPLGLQPVGPKAPPAPPPDGPMCLDDSGFGEAVGNCIGCFNSFEMGNPGDPFTPGDSCAECLAGPGLVPCPPPPPPGPDCESLPLIEGVPPPCTPKPPCGGGGS